jgi:hypothetical protein
VGRTPVRGMGLVGGRVVGGGVAMAMATGTGAMGVGVGVGVAVAVTVATRCAVLVLAGLLRGRTRRATQRAYCAWVLASQSDTHMEVRLHLQGVWYRYGMQVQMY